MRELEAEHRRLTILRHLEGCARHTSNASILTDVANGLGVASTRTQIEADLSFLESIGLVTLERVGTFTVATATLRGTEVATGHATSPGVKRPSPGER